MTGHFIIIAQNSSLIYQELHLATCKMKRFVFTQIQAEAFFPEDKYLDVLLQSIEKNWTLMF